MSAQDGNQRVYDGDRAAQACAGLTALQPAELRVLVEQRNAIWGRDVLDLGCGAGRTSAYLSLLTAHYTGADYSAAMIDLCRRRFPDLRFVQADARNLLDFKAAEFDFVLFSYNGLDSMPHEDRLQALAEIHRVLRPGGVFAFSSHNRDFVHARSVPRLELAGRRPRGMLRALLRYRRCRRNHRRLRAHERETAEYAIWNDCAHDFALLNYYVTRACQLRQLGRLGFEVQTVLDADGQPLGPASGDTHSPWIHYVSRKLD